METNFHTHTRRCGHASGEDRDYVESAIRSGIKVLGFSDHSPYFFDGSYYSTFRMKREETEGYVNSVLALRKEYAADIDIKLGFETEYYPKYFEKLIEFYSQFPVDYIIMGQHCLLNETEGLYSAAQHKDPAKLKLYVDQVIEGLKTGCFTYLAHPDLFNFTGDRSIWREEYGRLCEGTKALDIPLEINLLGMREGRHYPTKEFFEIAAEHGCDVITGCDAHSPKVVCDTKSEALADSWCSELGLNRVEYPKLRRPVL